MVIGWQTMECGGGVVVLVVGPNNEQTNSNTVPKYSRQRGYMYRVQNKLNKRLDCVKNAGVSSSHRSGVNATQGRVSRSSPQGGAFPLKSDP